MKIGGLETGTVAPVVGARLAGLGHDVTIGTGNAEALLAGIEPDVMGDEPFAAWKQATQRIALGTFAEAPAAGTLYVNATNAAGSLDALRAAGDENLDVKR
jgi:hypothetical protein